MVSIEKERSEQLVRVRTATMLSILGAATLAGCGAHTDAGMTRASAESEVTAPTAMTPVERLAEDLAEADLAFKKGDSDELAQRLRSIELAGAKPSGAHEELALQSWRDSANVSAPPMRGRVLGPAYLSGMLAPGARIDTEQVLLGGKAVSIAAGTAPKGGLRLRIARGDGKTVCEQSPAHARECRFVPTFTQRYRIELFNAGKQDARYHLVFD